MQYNSIWLASWIVSRIILNPIYHLHWPILLFDIDLKRKLIVSKMPVLSWSVHDVFHNFLISGIKCIISSNYIKILSIQALKVLDTELHITFLRSSIVVNTTFSKYSQKILIRSPAIHPIIRKWWYERPWYSLAMIELYHIVQVFPVVCRIPVLLSLIVTAN